MEQVWFSGVHTNIGGGYLDSKLSDITFKWMAEKASECGLSLDEDYIKEYINPHYAGVLRNSRKGFYRLTPIYRRQIGIMENSAESVHDMANQRYKDKALKYRPPNLEDYYSRISSL